MKRILAVIICLAFATTAFADPSWLGEQEILNRAFDSTNNALDASITGTITSADVVTDRLIVYDDTAIEDKISIDVVGGHAEFQPYSISAIKFNSSMADTDFVIGSVIDSEAFAVDSSTGRVGIGTRTPAVSMDVIGQVNAETLELTEGNITYLSINDNIETAIAAATAGDTIVLAAGTYTVTDDIDIAQSINVVGQGVGQTTIACATSSKNIFHITADDVRIADLSISSTGASAAAIFVDATATTVFSNVIIENIDITMNSTGVQRGVYYQDAGGTIRDVVLSVTSSNNLVQAVYMQNAATAEAPTTLKCYNVDSFASAAATSCAAFLVQDNGASQDCFMYVYNSRGVASGASGVAAGFQSYEADAFAYAENCVFNGANTDVSQGASSTTTLYDTTLVNNTTSGTITYGGTVVSKGAKLSEGASGATAYAGYDTFVLEDDAIMGMSFLFPDASHGNINFGTPTSQYTAGIRADYNAGSEYLSFRVADSEKMRIDDTGMTTLTSASTTKSTLLVDANGATGATGEAAVRIDSEQTDTASLYVTGAQDGTGTSPIFDASALAVVSEGVGGAAYFHRDTAGTAPMVTILDDNINTTVSALYIRSDADASATQPIVSLETSSAACDQVVLKATQAGTAAGAASFYRNTAATSGALLELNDDNVDSQVWLLYGKTDADASATYPAVEFVTTNAAHDQPVLQVTQGGTAEGIEVLRSAVAGVDALVRIYDSHVDSAGSALQVYSSQDATSNVSMAHFETLTNTCDTPVITMTQAGVTSTNFFKMFSTNGITIYASDGTAAEGNLSGTAGDICLKGADDGVGAAFCTGTTNWTDM